MSAVSTTVGPRRSGPHVLGWLDLGGSGASSIHPCGRFTVRWFDPRHRRRLPAPVIDALIAATALTLDATVVTRDDSNIARAGARTFSPWSA